jgi:lysophospholipase L1-like esterase
MRIVGLGDSVGFGVGDVGEQFIGPGWAGRLGAIMGAEKVLHLALPGARAADLPSTQLPAALAFRPDIAVISAGGNDVLRADYDPAVVHENIGQTIQGLKAAGVTCLVMGLPDPLRTAPLPYMVKRALSRRTMRLNEVLREVCEQFGAVFISNWFDERVYERANWHVDRMHPSPVGYQNLAEKSVELMGWEASNPPITVQHGTAAPNRIVWLLVFGSLWFLRRSKDLIPRLMMLTLLETRDVLLRRPLPQPVR